MFVMVQTCSQDSENSTIGLIRSRSISQHSSTHIFVPGNLFPQPDLNYPQPVAFWLGLAGQQPLFVYG
jgi:hypothetical protein